MGLSVTFRLTFWLWNEQECSNSGSEAAGHWFSTMQPIDILKISPQWHLFLSLWEDNSTKKRNQVSKSSACGQHWQVIQLYYYSGKLLSQKNWSNRGVYCNKKSWDLQSSVLGLQQSIQYMGSFILVLWHPGEGIMYSDLLYCLFRAPFIKGHYCFSKCSHTQLVQNSSSTENTVLSGSFLK